MNAEMLPVLHLRRQAATYGWQFLGRRPDNVFVYCRVDEDGTHEASVDPGRVPAAGEDWSHYRSLRCTVRSSDGWLQFAHTSVGQAVRMLRGYAGWPAAVEAVRS
jgi:hypothetical protein